MRTVFNSVRARLSASATAMVGIAAIGGCAQTAEPQPTAQPVATQPIADEPRVTTQAIGEEDGGYYAPPSDGFATTLAVGEEDGSGPFPVEPNGGIGDGAGPIPFEPGTPQIGEVEGDYERIYIPPEPGYSSQQPSQPVYGQQVTTLAIGEEG